MKQIEYQFSNQHTTYYLNDSIARLKEYVPVNRAVLIVDEQVNKQYHPLLEGWHKIEVPSGEDSKDVKIFQQIIDALIQLEADRKTTLIGIGGGVVSDLTGFVASVYMRGVPFAFVPTTVLAQVDAAIGGKNGINHGMYKNMLGTIRQPSFILFDYEILSTLPDEEWHNGFAEIIKYACIQDAVLFDYLENNREKALNKSKEVIAFLVETSVSIKSRIVQEDEFESGARRWLNFGHTLGHAVEKLEGIAHGKAVAIGMVAAAKFSEKLRGLDAKDTNRIIRLINDYQLPVTLQTDKEAVFNLFKMDKKREKNFIHFVLLDKIGQATTQPIGLDQLKALLKEL